MALGCDSLSTHVYCTCHVWFSVLLSGTHELATVALCTQNLMLSKGSGWGGEGERERDGEREGDRGAGGPKHTAERAQRCLRVKIPQPKLHKLSNSQEKTERVTSCPTVALLPWGLHGGGGRGDRTSQLRFPARKMSTTLPHLLEASVRLPVSPEADTALY